MQEIQIFSNPEFGEIRTVTIDGEPWFVAMDISDKLGYAQTANMLKQIESDDKKKFAPSKMDDAFSSMTRQVTIVNESGLYAAIFGSKQESARKFKHWVTSEVLPQIRKSGCYVMPEVCSPCEIPLGELASYLKVMDRVAHRQNLAPHKIAANFKKVSEQFGIHLTDDFVNVPEYEQLTLTDIM